MTTNQTPDSALDASVERVMARGTMHSERKCFGHYHSWENCDPSRNAIRQELEARYEAGRRDALEEALEITREYDRASTVADKLYGRLATPTETKPT